jgi:prepilin-type N-terminal cleavage/methylation domain-containing protein
VDAGLGGASRPARDLHKLFGMKRWIPSGRAGFSLVELLVVVAFIAILAAIAVPHFASVTDRAHDATVKSDVRNAMSAEEEYYVSAGEYAEFVAADGERITPPGYATSPGVTVTATVVDGGLRLVGSHPGATSSWCINSADGEVVPGEEC